MAAAAAAVETRTPRHARFTARSRPPVLADTPISISRTALYAAERAGPAARPRQTLVDVGLALASGEARRAVAVVRADQVATGARVLARRRRALVDVRLAAQPKRAARTRALVAPDEVATSPAVPARLARTLVHILLAQRALEPEIQQAVNRLNEGWFGSRVVSVLDSGAEGPGSTLSGNSLRQTVHTHCASVHQAAKLVAALLRVARVTAGLVESNGSLPPGL